MTYWRPMIAAIAALAIAITISTTAKAAPSSVISLANFAFDYTKGEPKRPSGLDARKPVKGGRSFVIVKFKSHDNLKARRRLEKLGARFSDYIPVDSFLAKLPYGKREKVESDPDVAFVTDYAPAYRLDKGPLNWFEKKESGKKKVIVQLFDDEELAPVMADMKRLGVTPSVISDRPGPCGKALRAEVDASVAGELASVDGVLWVEEELVPKLHNDVAAGILNSTVAWGQYVPLSGTGQVVAVCDTGLDTGNTSTIHTDFAGLTSDGAAKIKSTFTYGRAGVWSDPDGHGTHTCGSAVGFGAKSDQLVSGLHIRGMAYDAQLVMQSTLNASGGLTVPSLDYYVFPDAYSAGARVHSNSWGYQYSGGMYTFTARTADTYAWQHKDFLAVFSAGNDGVDSTPADGVVDSGSVSSPSTAKDVISVGASENDRATMTASYGQAIPGLFNQAPINSDKMADNTSGMAAFSGRGPCLDGRIKPDIVAPGTYVVSTRSSLASSSAYWRLPSQMGYSSSLDPFYAADGGTSMSAPLVAGNAALVRERLIQLGFSQPSSALVKAALINGAHDMAPGQYGGGATKDVTARPDNNQGWGRVDIRESLFPTAPKVLLFAEHTEGLSTGGGRVYRYTAAAGTPARVTLVWTDYPGSSVTGTALVNDLDLTVTAPDGAVYHGNMFTGSDSAPGATGYDRANNVEGVSIPASAMTSSGTLTVTVTANNTPYGPQAFAVAVSGAVTAQPDDNTAPAAPTGLKASPRDGAVNLTWNANTEPDLAGYRVYFSGYSTTVGKVSTRLVTGLTNGQSYEFQLKAMDTSYNLSPASTTASATPFSASVELPHTSYDGSPAWGCTACHAEGGELLPSGFDYKTDTALCVSCHNAASVGHGSVVSSGSSHPVMVDVTSGGGKRPTYGSVTSGEWSDSMRTHLKDGRLIVCATCHNPMRKPNDTGRYWELASATDGKKFRPYRGGWWDQGHADARVYQDNSLWTPTYTKDREKLLVAESRYTLDSYTGAVTFANRTGDYVYFSLDDPYLRAPGGDNTICADCHTQSTHEALNCLGCHGMHGNVNIRLVRSKVKKPGGATADVVFRGLTGAGSFADGGAVRNGICEVCHTTTSYYRADGSGAHNHIDGNNYDRRDCSTCHTHTIGFGSP